ncbi:membrane protein [Streptomyces phage Faust]|uniref:Membrane protein n=1 Tax=Streptomyces phage Faust TaxID=2767565 RepID=A0A7G9UZ45_9CAUD|nr:membrane protein [Streptomyces phage Faust]QNN99300.1 membrane protein [Streptomyces phage Faust]
MNYSLILGIISFFFAVVCSVIAAMVDGFDIVAIMFYGGAVAGICFGMLNSSSKVNDNG